MNKFILIIFLVLLSISFAGLLLTGKTSISKIIKAYFKNYYSNAFEEKDRKFNFWIFLFFGIMPYCLGLLLFFSFEYYLMNFDTDLLFQIDVILLTIFSLFIAFNLRESAKEQVKKELFSSLIVGILLIVISVLILLIGVSLPSGGQFFDSKRALFAIFYSLNFKVFVVFLYSLKRVFFLGKI